MRQQNFTDKKKKDLDDWNTPAIDWNVPAIDWEIPDDMLNWEIPDDMKNWGDSNQDKK